MKDYPNFWFNEKQPKFILKLEDNSKFAKVLGTNFKQRHIFGWLAK